MSEDQWSILLEHEVHMAAASIDGETILMLGLEEVLADERIDVAYDPFRPGEAFASARSFTQPIRMLVPTRDLARAKQLLEEFRSAPFEFEGFDDGPEEEPEPVTEEAPDSDTVDGR